MIGVGMMDRYIELHMANNASNNVYGGTEVVSYSRAGSVWAHVVYKGGKVSEEGMQMQNNQTVEFFVRNAHPANELSVKDFILFDNDKFNIHYINAIDGRKKFLKIEATFVTPNNIQD